MSDTTVTTETPTSTPQATPMPNDQAARSATGEILEPSQIKPPEVKPETPTSTDGKAPATTSTSETKPEAKPEAKPAGAPEKYEDFKAPDGYTLDAKTIEAATPIFKELGLSQEQAQRLVQFYSEQMIAAAEGPQAAFETLQTEWRTKLAADTDMKAAINGDKTGLDAVKLDIGRALNAIGDTKLVDEFKQVMNTTGVGDNPAFVKALWKLSSFVTEGKHVAGAGPSSHGQTDPSKATPRTGAQALYPNLPQ